MDFTLSEEEGMARAAARAFALGTVAPEAAEMDATGAFPHRAVEEAQRLGRLLRPNKDGLPASFYTLVTRDTVDQDFAQNRQRFLAEQGYAYTILDADQVLAAA